MTSKQNAPPFFGVPAATWAFALRTWVAMMAALYAALWLQLQGGSSAAVTVGLLAAPTRGPEFQKALFRLVGTAVGLGAAIALAGLFNETRTLFLGALAVWLALCVFVGGLLDGNNAYAAVLSGYTVAIVAVPNIDTPQATFASAVDRGAAIVLGIAVLAVVDSFAPDALPGLRARIGALRGEVRRVAAAARAGRPPGPAALAKLFGEVTALRAGALALPAESIAGHIRAAAARRALASLAAELWRARAPGGPPDPAQADGNDDAVGQALRSLASGRGPARGPALPIKHPVAAAGRNAVRVCATFGLACAFFAASGWPATTEGLLHVAIFMCLSATNPDPRSYALATVLATMSVIGVVGVTEFLVLDGADAFPQLAIALFPTVVAAAVLKASKDAVRSAMGNRILIFTIVILSPGLSQSYDAQRYLSTSVVLMAGALIFVAGRTTILPLEPRLRRRWLIAAARRDLAEARAGRGRAGTEAAYWWADLVAQMGRLAKAGGPDGRKALDEACRLADAAMAARREREVGPGRAGQTAR